jgi:hypothetical protein
MYPLSPLVKNRSNFLQSLCHIEPDISDIVACHLDNSMKHVLSSDLRTTGFRKYLNILEKSD